MKKTFSTLAILMLVILVMTVSEVLAAPDPLAADKKPSKTPGAQQTANALKFAEKHPDKQKGQDDIERVKTIKVNVKGTVVSFDAAQVVVMLRDNSLVTVLLNADTGFKLPKLNPNKKVKATVAPTEPVSTEPAPTEPAPLSLPPLTVGAQVTIKAIKMEDGSLMATRISLIPGKPTKVYRVGVVKEYTAGVSLTIETKQGETSTFVLTADTVYLPKERMAEMGVGRTVTVVCPRDVTGGVLTAKKVIIHPVKDVVMEPTEAPTEAPTVEPSAAPTEG